eukprot:Hpha_TRINITY_DN1632_c0_g1::TRINITY_DN1632_c0_g1_i1::g.48800::m.48800
MGASASKQASRIPETVWEPTTTSEVKVSGGTPVSPVEHEKLQLGSAVARDQLGGAYTSDVSVSRSDVPSADRGNEISIGGAPQHELRHLGQITHQAVSLPNASQANKIG